ncbi:hypothetical protein [Georgenia sp. SUBG003]|uniref:hypothetical protein n=1 Tax=Georgenia sp. SUBG003 TaxID=1497974 RepID=UPI003AB8FF39
MLLQLAQCQAGLRDDDEVPGLVLDEPVQPRGVEPPSDGRSWPRSAPPDAGTVRRATGTGIRGMLPLQAALTAAAGHPVLGGALVTAVPALRTTARKLATT